ncbi:LA2681 family HEPN domain-containing protein [Gillisia sp. Hel_I_29]|uniref:LA2681 family HEPN domain-containing protein n=1 Tax=Gillisia sp. Hel_I_29 TaxID=1249975 RepID=UPI00069116E8|nr:LA2681 family HEPN domain-containing protein [Gillisia sp. Hel_I_29]
MNLTLKEILNLPDLNNFETGQVPNALAILFETGRQSEDVKIIRQGLKFAEDQSLENFSNDEKMVFHYNVANGWSYFQRLTEELNSDQFWRFSHKELDQQIINLRLALSYSHKSQNRIKKCEILTNLGNVFSHLGRFSEAQLYWKKVLSVDSSFPMAFGNIGFGLFHYAKTIYDSGHQFLFFQFAHKYLLKTIDTDIYDEAKSAFQNTINLIESFIEKEELKNIQDLKHFSLGESKGEIQYRKWCLKNHLFLNPLNDITTENIAGHDCLLLPTMTLNFDKTPFYQTIFNQIKQEFVSARHLLFEGLNQKETHYSDKDNLQLDTLDFAVYSYSSEKTKIAFRMCYSILDKIGYLLNDYLDLGFQPEKVSFRSIWIVYDKKSKTSKMNPKISQTQNWPLRGLYWLSRDFFEKDESFSSTIEPEAKELAKIRNFIEHKSFKIIEFGENGLFDKNLTYAINREEFEKKTLNLIKLVRASMIYLAMGINLEERKKEINKPVVPIDFIGLRDEYKR